MCEALVYVCMCVALSIRCSPDYVRCCCVYKPLTKYQKSVYPSSVKVLDIPTSRQVQRWTLRTKTLCVTNASSCFRIIMSFADDCLSLFMSEVLS